MLHIENLTVHVNSGTAALSRAFIDALLRGPEVDTGAEGEAPAPTATTSQPPRIGQYWPGQGGIYGGMARGLDGQDDYPLILAACAPEQEFKWPAAMEHAKTIEADGHKDFNLPTRFEAALLYANLRDQFDTNYVYWTGTQYGEYRAFIQYFAYGLQTIDGKDCERRCRFVRRMPLQSFNPLVLGAA